MAVTAACLGLVPVAKAFGEGSSITYTSGLGRPVADGQGLHDVVQLAGSGSGRPAGRPETDSTMRAPGPERDERSRPGPEMPAITGAQC